MIHHGTWKYIDGKWLVAITTVNSNKPERNQYVMVKRKDGETNQFKLIKPLYRHSEGKFLTLLWAVEPC